MRYQEALQAYWYRVRLWHFVVLWKMVEIVMRWIVFFLLLLCVWDVSV